MSTAGALNSQSKKALADLARRRGIRGWESMDKGALVKALSSRTAPSAAKVAKKASKPKPQAKARPAARVAARPASKSKPLAHHATRVAARPSAKPMPKPASKVTRPVPLPAKPPISKSTSTPAPSSNGTSKPAAKPAVPPVKSVLPAAKPTSMPIPVANLTKPVAKASGKLVTKPAVVAPARPLPPPREMPPRMPSVPQAKDKIILAVNDPYWLHVMWDLSALSVQRAEAAFKQDWYGAKLILRLSDVTSQDTTSTSETPIRDIPIEGDGRNWYINVTQPPRQYRVDIGYISRRGDFFPIARSNVVTPPKAGSSEALEAGWEKDPKKLERTLAMSTGFESAGSPELKAFYEQYIGRSIGPPKETSFGTGATLPGALKKFFFDIDAKLIVLGRTDPTAHLTLGNDPIRLNADGTFVMSFNLPDSRQIIPAVATSADGVEERTIVLAVERNTKYLDPMIHDHMNEV
jgi:uncharacterized protein